MHQPCKANIFVLWGKKIHQPRGETRGVRSRAAAFRVYRIVMTSLHLRRRRALLQVTRFTWEKENVIWEVVIFF